MRKIKFIGLILLCSIILVACSGESINESIDSNINTSSAVNSTEPMERAVAQDIVKNDSDGQKKQSTANPQVQVSLDQASNKTEESEPKTERKIIRNANLELETNSPEEASQKITAIAKSKNGFVITSTQKSTNAKVGGRDSVSMSIRVPAEKFEESLAEIRKTVERVVVETVTGQDVTEEFVDIQARLKTKKALEERYLEIMKRANSVEDALKVEAQLGELRTEIEQIEGRKRFLENQASLSTINIELRTPAAISASSSGFFYELKEAFSDGFEAALTFILVLVRILIAIVPFLILIVLPIFLILKFFWRKQNNKQKTAKKIIEAEIREE